MLNIALFGPPGAGKGTQSEYLIQKYHLHYISTGDLLRKEISEKSALGMQAQNIIASGGLVSDEIIVQIMEKTITSHPQANGFLFDGFPRTYTQAYILEGLMIKLNTQLDALISIKVSEEVSLERLVSRGKTSSRSDDNEEVILNRLREYNDKTLPVLNFYQAKGLVTEIDGTQSIDDVKEHISQIINVVMSKRIYIMLLFGSPGSGRGTQGKALAKKFDLEYVSTGRMLYEELQERTDISEKIKELFVNSELVPDEIIIQLIEKRIEHSQNVKGFIFKGFPRTFVQSYILDGILKKHNYSISQIIHLEVPTLELISRLDKRSKTDRRMPYDSSTERILKRMSQHETITIPVIHRYEKLNRFVHVDGRGSQEDVFLKLSEIVEEGIRTVR